VIYQPEEPEPHDTLSCPTHGFVGTREQLIEAQAELDPSKIEFVTFALLSELFRELGFKN
jgi:hypothetical protein